MIVVLKKIKIILISSFALLLSSQYVLASELEINGKLPNLGNGTGVVLTEKGLKQVKFQNRGGLNLFEGDIRVVREQLGLPRHDHSIQHSVTVDGFRWPENTLYYSFNNVTTGVVSMVRQAVAHINENTNVTIVEVADSSSTYHVRVQDNDFACWSYVGNLEGALQNSRLQELNVVVECGFGATVHEFLHALGIFHEQSREDRDDYVDIISANIIDGLEGNFEKVDDIASDVGAYDYSSIMHYGSTAFTKNGGATIIPKQPGVTIGQRNGLSAGDINAINAMYPIRSGIGNPTAVPATIVPYLLFDD